MTAEEIRACSQRFLDRMKELDTTPNELSLMVLMAGEIAAQLAELNTALRTDKAIVMMPVPAHTKENQ